MSLKKRMGDHPVGSFKIVNRKNTMHAGIAIFTAFVACTISNDGWTQSFPTLPDCRQPGQTVTLDLSTGTTNGNTNAFGAVDPKWLVFSTPPGTGLNNLPASPYSIQEVTPWAPATAPATWIQPWPGPGPNFSNTATNGPYAYEVDFNIPHPPSSYTSISITGQCRADDGAFMWMNSNSSPTQIQNCGPFTGNNPPTQPLNFSFTGANFFHLGTNAFQVQVDNTGGPPTGLMISAKLTAVCPSPQGILKVCKVAGHGIPVGTVFSYTTGGSSTPFQVPAGPAPGGTCVIAGSFPVGATVNVTEMQVPNDAVSNIAAEPPSSLVSMVLATGTANVRIGSGVTEVTYTNYNKPGYLEICKNGRGSGSFTVNPGNLGPFTVTAGSCSPAIQVSAGPVSIHETSSFGTAMSGCATIPSSQLVSCTPSNQSLTVNVVPGGVSDQTIATVTNKKNP
jgi:hypothetical protein